MKRYRFVALAAALTASAALWARAQTPMPGVGQRAPDISLLGSDGRAHGLRSHLGRQPVVLAFFPKAFTKG